MLTRGAKAPTLDGLDQNGRRRSIAEAKGGFLVVYFYPKDGTPGCTAEACAFRDVWDRYVDAKVAVYGVSSDDQLSHDAFAKEHSLPFPLIADPEGVWASGFGVRTFLGMTERVSFLIGPDGSIAAVYEDVDPGVHSQQILADIKALR